MKHLLIGVALAAALAACGGGGGSGNPPPTPNPPPVTSPPSSPPTSPPPSVSPSPLEVDAAQVSGVRTITVKALLSANAGLTGLSACGERITGLVGGQQAVSDSPLCDPAHPYPGGQGPAGNSWISPLTQVNDGTYLTGTFQCQSSGGCLGILALVYANGTATFLNLTNSAINMAVQDPAFQVLASTGQAIMNDSPMGGQQFPTVGSLLATIGGFAYDYQPVEVQIDTNGVAGIAVHSALALFGTGAALTAQQGFVPDGQTQTVEFYPCPTLGACSVGQVGSPIASVAFGLLNSGNYLINNWPYATAGDLYGFVNFTGFTEHCGYWGIQQAGGSLLVLWIYQTQQAPSGGNNTTLVAYPAGVQPPENCSFFG